VRCIWFEVSIIAAIQVSDKRGNIKFGQRIPGFPYFAFSPKITRKMRYSKKEYIIVARSLQYQVGFFAAEKEKAGHTRTV
jgi:hypothetical protein